MHATTFGPLKAISLGLALAAVSISAVPAQAPNLFMGLEAEDLQTGKAQPEAAQLNEPRDQPVPADGGLQSLPGIAEPRVGAVFQGQPGRLICFTDHQLRQSIEEQGFSNVYVGGLLGEDHLRMRGTSEGWEYLLVVDRCDGSILEIRPYRAAVRR